MLKFDQLNKKHEHFLPRLKQYFEKLGAKVQYFGVEHIPENPRFSPDLKVDFLGFSFYADLKVSDKLDPYIEKEAFLHYRKIVDLGDKVILVFLDLSKGSARWNFVTGSGQTNGFRYNPVRLHLLRGRTTYEKEIELCAERGTDQKFYLAPCGWLGFRDPLGVNGSTKLCRKVHERSLLPFSELEKRIKKKLRTKSQPLNTQE